MTSSMVLIAGGFGTRLNKTYDEIPKSLVPIANKPILQHQLEFARQHGITNCLILTGYLGNQIKNFVGNGSKFGMSIQCIQETQPLGTAGGFNKLPYSWTFPTLILYGDILCNFDLSRFINFHNINKGIATLIVRPNDHPFDSDLIETNSKNRIVRIHKKPRANNLYINNLDNASVYIIEKNILNYIPRGKSDWAHDIFPQIIKNGERFYAYRSSEYFLDIGTPSRLKQAERDILNGKVKISCYMKKRPCIFINIDCLINKTSGHQYELDNITLLPKSPQAIQLANQSNYLIIAISNPEIIRRLRTKKQVKIFHNKLETNLGFKFAYLDQIYYYTHNKKTKYFNDSVAMDYYNDHEISLIKQAVFDHNIDLSNSYFVRDINVNIKPEINIELNTIFVKTRHSKTERHYCSRTTYITKNLLVAVQKIIAGDFK